MRATIHADLSPVAFPCTVLSNQLHSEEKRQVPASSDERQHLWLSERPTTYTMASSSIIDFIDLTVSNTEYIELDD